MEVWMGKTGRMPTMVVFGDNVATGGAEDADAALGLCILAIAVVAKYFGIRLPIR